MAAMRIGSHLMDFWTLGTRRCALFGINRTLELRLYDNDQLVALRVCESGVEALHVSEEWRTQPPSWPPF